MDSILPAGTSSEPDPVLTPPNSSPLRESSLLNSSQSVATAIAPIVSTDKSLVSEIQDLFHESTASLDEAVSRPAMPIKAGPGASTGQQLLVAVLEANLKLEKEKMELRTVIESFQNQSAQLNRIATVGNETEGVRSVSGVMGEGKGGSCEECRILKKMMLQKEEQLRNVTEEMRRVKQELEACKAEMRAIRDEL